MFPDVYADHAFGAGFRQRHGAALRAQALVATQRLLTHWDGVAHIYLGRREVDDWLVAAGLAQFLFVRRTGRLVLRGAAGKQSALTVAWLTFLLDRLVFAVSPSLSALITAEVGMER
jgi:hypothetical protein